MGKRDEVDKALRRFEKQQEPERKRREKEEQKKEARELEREMSRIFGSGQRRKRKL